MDTLKEEMEQLKEAFSLPEFFEEEEEEKKGKRAPGSGRRNWFSIKFSMQNQPALTSLAMGMMTKLSYSLAECLIVKPSVARSRTGSNTLHLWKAAVH